MNNFIKKLTGIVSIFTPFIILFPGLLFFNKNNPSWWHSLSASYYNLPTCGAFITCFCCLSVLLILNKGVLPKIAGILLLLVLIFPCADKTIQLKKDYIGIFNLYYTTSDKIHSLASFSSLVVITIEILYFLYKSKVKKVYIISLLFIVIAITMIITENVFHFNGNWSLHWTTIISESLLFISFGRSFYFSGLENEKLNINGLNKLFIFY